MKGFAKLLGFVFIGSLLTSCVVTPQNNHRHAEHRRMPPGQAKKYYGGNARHYAPGHHKHGKKHHHKGPKPPKRHK